MDLGTTLLRGPLIRFDQVEGPRMNWVAGAPSAVPPARWCLDSWKSFHMSAPCARGKRRRSQTPGKVSIDLRRSLAAAARRRAPIFRRPSNNVRPARQRARAAAWCGAKSDADDSVLRCRSQSLPGSATRPAPSMPAIAAASSFTEISPEMPTAPRRFPSADLTNTPPGTGTNEPPTADVTELMK